MSSESNKIHITLGIAVTFMLTAVLNATQGYMLPQYIDYYPMIASNQGLMSSMQSVGSIVALILVVTCFKKDAAKRSIYKGSLVIMIVFCLIMYTRPKLAFALTAYAFMGGAVAWQSSTTSSITSDIRPTDEVAPYMGLLHGAFGVGGLIAPMAFLTLENASLDWNQIFLVLLVVTLIVTLAVWRIFKNYDQIRIKSKLAKHENKGMNFQDAKQFFVRRSNVLLLLCAFMYAAHQICVSLWIKQYMLLEYSNRLFAALALSLFWIGTAAARIGQIFIRIPLERQLLFGNLCASIFVLIGLLMHNSIIMVFSVFAAGLSAGASIPILLSLSTKNNPFNSFVSSSTVLFVVYISQLILPAITSALAKTYSFRVSIFIAALSALFCSVIAYIMNKVFVTENKE